MLTAWRRTEAKLNEFAELESNIVFYVTISFAILFCILLTARRRALQERVNACKYICHVNGRRMNLPN